MYDGATALAEAAIMAGELTGRKKLAVLGSVHPVYRHVLDTYLRHMNLSAEIIVDADGVGDETAAVIVQQPSFFGTLQDMTQWSEAAHAKGALLIACVDPISLGIITPPGEYDADIVVGEGQALGCPMGYGGPLLGFFACKNKFMRRLPGRIVGQTKDGDGVAKLGPEPTREKLIALLNAGIEVDTKGASSPLKRATASSLKPAPTR